MLIKTPIKSFLAAALLAISATVAAAAVDINSADAKALETLNGIGPAKAAAIIDYRKKNGSFKSVDDLGKVDGIGDKTVDQLRGQVTVGGAKAAAKAPAGKAKAD